MTMSTTIKLSYCPYCLNVKCICGATQDQLLEQRVAELEMKIELLTEQIETLNNKLSRQIPGFQVAPFVTSCMSTAVTRIVP